MFNQKLKGSFALLSAFLVQQAFADACPSLQGFYALDLRKKTHIEYYDIAPHGKIDRYHYRSFNPDGSAVKVEFVADGKTHPAGKDSEVTAKCSKGEFLRSTHSWTKKDGDFPGSDYFENRRTQKDADGNLSVFVTTIYKTSDGFYSERRYRSVFKGYDGTNFPQDDRELKVVSFPSLRGSGTGNPDEAPSIFSYLWVNGFRMSPSLDQRDMSMLILDPKTLKVSGYYQPPVRFPFAVAHGEAPAPNQDFTVDMDWDPAVLNPKFTSWNSSYEQCEIESSKKACKRNRYDNLIGELSFESEGHAETLTNVIDTKVTEIPDPACCANL